MKRPRKLRPKHRCAATRAAKSLTAQVDKLERKLSVASSRADDYAKLLLNVNRWSVSVVRALSPDGIEMTLSRDQLVGRECALCHAPLAAHSPAFELTATWESASVEVLLRCPAEQESSREIPAHALLLASGNEEH